MSRPTTWAWTWNTWKYSRENSKTSSRSWETISTGIPRGRSVFNGRFRINEINQAADKLVEDGHTEHDQIYKKRDDVNEAWHRLNSLAATRKEGLFGAHQVQRFNRDADETLAWIAEKVGDF